MAHRPDEVEVFGNRYEITLAYQASLGMLPTHQRFKFCERARLQVYDRLMVQHKLGAPSHRTTKVRFDL